MSSHEGFIVCPRCGERLPEGFTRCDACGAYLAAVPAAGSGASPNPGGRVPSNPGAVRSGGKSGGGARPPAHGQAPKGKRPAPKPKLLGLSSSTWIMIAVGLLIGGAIGFSLKKSIGAKQEGGMPKGPADVMAGGGGMPPGGGGMPAGIMEEVQKDKAILEKNPDDVAANIDLGNLLFDSNQWEKATEHYGRALAKEPGNADVRVDMAIAYHNLGQDQKAREELERVTKSHPDHKNAWLNLGVIAQSTGDTKAAVAAWEQYLKLDPSGQHAAAIRDEVDRMKKGL
ncbi:MAG: tetratricopeptide repeat protein [Hyphomicrobiales bacterium]